MPQEPDRYRRPESVLVVIYTAALESLLLERVDPPGFWQSVTGTMHWGESARAAAIREVREETGIKAEALRDARITRSFEILPAWRARYAPDVTENREHLWYLELPRRVDVVLDAAEHSRFEWVGVAEAARRVYSWTNREALERLLPGDGERRQARP